MECFYSVALTLVTTEDQTWAEPVCLSVVIIRPGDVITLHCTPLYHYELSVIYFISWTLTGQWTVDMSDNCSFNVLQCRSIAWWTELCDKDVSEVR